MQKKFDFIEVLQLIGAEVITAAEARRLLDVDTALKAASTAS